MNALPYLLTASLYLLLFYGSYWLLLRQNTFFALNRAYLLASVVLSLLLPLIELPGGAAESLPVGTITLPAFAVGTDTPTDVDGLPVSQWLWLVYGLGVGAMLVRLGLNLRAVFRLIRQGDIEQYPNYSLVQLPDDATPSFSFGRFLVLNRTDALTQPDVLLRHEEAHIRQHHTTDILFMELARAAFWFHPVLWLYKRALQEVHEFLADQAVLRTPQPDYARQLVAYALNVPATALTTPFVSVSTLKQRIVMLQKPQSNRRALLAYALALPLAALLAMCTQPENEQPQNEAGLAKARTATRPVKVEGKIYDAVEESPQFPGGREKLGEYLGQNLKYPVAAEKAKAEGTVFINFILTKEGDVTDLKVLKGIGYGADEEAVRVMSGMPRWIPAKQNGKAVNVRYNMPIRFQLEEDEPATNAKQSSFFSPPTNDAEIRQIFKHFIVDGKEVSFNEFKRYSKNGIIESSTSDQTIRIQTTPPPPPPPVPANDASALKEVSQLTHPKHFFVDDKEVEENEFLQRSRTEKHWEVVKADPASQTVYITTK